MATLWDTLYDCGCQLLVDPFPHLRHCRHHRRHTRRVIVMAHLAPGQSTGLHATAYLDDAATQVDPHAVITWRSDNEAIATVADLGSTGGTGACTVTGVVDGDCGVIAIASNPGGLSIDSPSEPITVASPAVKVVITEDPAAPPAVPPAA